MHFELNDDLSMLQEMTRDFAEKEVVLKKALTSGLMWVIEIT